MQTNDNLNQVWGEPVKSVHSLQDLGKLVQTTPAAAATVTNVSVTASVEPPKAVEYSAAKKVKNVKLHQALIYSQAHPDETIQEIAEKFGVRRQSLYSLRTIMGVATDRMHGNPDSLAKARAVRAELLAKLRAEGKKEPRKPKKVKTKMGRPPKAQWQQAALSTSAAPIKGIPREAQATPLTIDYITRMNFNYNIGRAIECLSGYDVRGAILHLERELNK